MSDELPKKDDGEKKDKYSTLAESSNGRWWEFYFVRYAMGTVVGSLLVFSLFNMEGPSPSNEVYKLFFELGELLDIGDYGLFVLPILGLAYCYLASAPVLVLHASRSVLKGSDEESMMSYLAIFSVIAILVFYFIYSLSPLLGSIILLFVVVLIQASCIYISIKKRTSHYKSLCKKRAEVDNASKEYVESYKHLREHGNAFMIVIMEIVLAVILYGVKTPEHLLIAILAWVYPAAYIWFVGTFLENDFLKS